MSFEQIDIKRSYTSYGDENIAKSFLTPMLSQTKLYRRSVGFFSSSVFSTIIDGIVTLLRNEGKIQLIASPNLSAEDINAIDIGYKKREDIISGAFDRDFADALSELDDKCLHLLATLIANETMDIKIAVTNGSGIYHDKLGILEDFDGNTVVFYGSANSTASGYKNNYEKIRVIKSWIDSDLESIHDEIAEFDSLWNNTNPHVGVYDYTTSAKKQILNVLEHRQSSQVDGEKTIQLRDYQKEAINAWVANNHHGFYVMATGTGKTWTAIYSAKTLLDSENAMVVISAPYKHLVSQWAVDVKTTFPEAEIILVSSENANWETQLTNAIIRYKMFKDKQIIVITTNTSFNLPRFTNTIKKSKQDKLLIVDEAHRFSNRDERLKEEYKYMLGLSATPFSGTETTAGMALMSFFGGQVYNLPIEVALKKKFLVPYNYYPIFVSATEDEEENFNKYSAKMASCFRNGICIDKESLALYRMQRLRIISMAAEKTDKIQEILSATKEKDHLIVYCGDGKVYKNSDEEFRHIDFIKKELSKINHRASQFTASENITERMDRVDSFNLGIITALAAIRCLDEGINIPSIKGALILSSNDNYREFAQRRGRILRLYPGKESANIYDVIVLPSSSCPSMAKIELRRFYEYAKLATNFEELKDSFYNLMNEYGLEDVDIEYSFDNNGEEINIDE